jgi:hypothetical protein
LSQSFNDRWLRKSQAAGRSEISIWTQRRLNRQRQESRHWAGRRYEAALAEFRKETLNDGQMEGSAMAQFAVRQKSESDAQLAKAIRRNGVSGPSLPPDIQLAAGAGDITAFNLRRAA